MFCVSDEGRCGSKQLNPEFLVSFKSVKGIWEFRGREGKGKVVSLYFNIKNKIKNEGI